MHDDTLDLILELAEIERPTWADGLARLRASGVPLNEGGDSEGGDNDAGGSDDGTSKDDAADTDTDTDDTGQAGDDDGGDDGDDSELARARKSAAKANAELKRIKSEQDADRVKAQKEAGKWKDLYEEAQDKLDKLTERIETDSKRTLVEAALRQLKAHNPASAARMIDLADIEDEHDADRAAKALRKSDAYLFDKSPTRQKRGAGSDADDDDDSGTQTKTKNQPSRLRRGLIAAEKARTG